MNKEPVVAKTWVICHHCGEEHMLLPGIGAPVYWCCDILLCLIAGDEVFTRDSTEGVSKWRT